MRTAKRVTVEAGPGAGGELDLYYEVGGRSDGPVFLLNDGIGCDGFIWRYLQPQLESIGTVVHPHYRGHGQSGPARGPEDYTIEALVADQLAVLDQEGIRSAIVLGHSMGVQVSLEMALQAPDRVDGLVLTCGSFGRPLDTFRDNAVGRTMLPLIRRVVERFGPSFRPVVEKLAPTWFGWSLAQATEVNGRMLHKSDFIPYLEHMARMDPRVFVWMLEHAAEHTTEGRLAESAAPALILGGEKDNFTPYWVSEVMAEHLPDATLHMLRSGTHAAPLEHWELTWVHVRDWLAEKGLWSEDISDESVVSAAR